MLQIQCTPCKLSRFEFRNCPPLEGIVKHISKGTMVRYKMGVGINDQQTNRIEWSASLAGNSEATIAVMGISALIEGRKDCNFF